MDDDYDIEHCDIPCPRCGEYEVRSRRCDEWDCDDGWIDESESDPINVAPGEKYTMCRECFGTGYVRWCSKCGCDLNYLEYKQRKANRKEGHA